MLRTETVNDPARIAAHPCMLSINAAMQVDLFAQANASFVDGRIHSGFGGQPDFVIGRPALAGRSRRSWPLHAWHDKTDSSTVVPVLTNPGDVVPALGGDQRARMRRALRALAARAGPAAH